MTTTLSALGRQQREELIESVTVAVLFGCGPRVSLKEMVKSWIEAAIDELATRGLLTFQSANCPACGRDRLKAEHGVCAMGGCPCGGDF